MKISMDTGRLADIIRALIGDDHAEALATQIESLTLSRARDLGIGSAEWAQLDALCCDLTSLHLTPGPGALVPTNGVYTGERFVGFEDEGK